MRRPGLRLPPVTTDPFPHLVVPDFLDEGALSALLETLAGLDFELKESDLFSYYSGGDLTRYADSTLRRLGLAVGDSRWRQRVAAAFKTPPLRSFDLAAYVYARTGFLLPHDDRMEGREVAFTLNLTEGLTEESGGALQLYECSQDDRPYRVAKTLIPQFNSLILFRVGPRSWHQITEVRSDLKRLTLTGWYHS